MRVQTYQPRVRVDERRFSAPRVTMPQTPMIMQPVVPRSEELGKLILRVSVAGMMLLHGYAKMVNGIDWLFGLLASWNMSPVLAYGIYIGEVMAPVLIILGIGTRFAGLVMAFDMIMAVTLVRRPDLLTIRASNGGWAIELEALYFFGAMAIVFLGAGRYSVFGGRHWWD